MQDHEMIVNEIYVEKEHWKDSFLAAFSTLATIVIFGAILWIL